MIKCWEYEPGKRPSFKELQRRTSNYIKSIAGYLEMNFYTTEGKERNILSTEEREDREEEGGEDNTISELERVVEVYPPPINVSHFGDGEEVTEL